MATSMETCPLLKLPAELRNTSYRSVLVFDDEDIDIVFQAVRKKSRLLDSGVQIRSEGAAIFYSENTFRITDVENQRLHVTFFLESIGRNNAQKIMRYVSDALKPSRCSHQCHNNVDGYICLNGFTELKDNSQKA